MNSKKSLKAMLRIICAMISLCIIVGAVPYAVIAEDSATGGAESDDTGVLGVDLTYYYEVYKDYNLTKNYNSETVNIDVNTAVRDDGAAPKISAVLDKTALVWDDTKLGYNFNFNCKEGLYYIEFNYAPLLDSTSDIIREIKIDDKSPFVDAERIKFTRLWVPSGENIIDKYGDERAATMIQTQDYMDFQARDLDGIYNESLLFYIGEGSHKLTLNYVAGSMAISNIKLVPYSEIDDYAEYQAKNSGAKYTGEPITYEAENVTVRSERTVTGFSDKDTTVTPFEFGVNRINAIGGWYWRYGNDFLTWKINVPEDGLYKLALRVGQDYQGLVVYRQILIDDKVPFKEVLAYPFYAQSDYVTTTIGGDTPYLFYLTKGEHSLTVKAVAGEMESIVNGLQETANLASDVFQDIQVVTTSNPDPNLNYFLDEKIPDLIDRLTNISNRIDEIAERLKELCKDKPPKYSVLKANAEKIKAMIDNPRIISLRISDISTVQGELADYSTQFKLAPLAMDYFQLLNPDEKVVQKQSSFWANLKLAYYDFVQSFTKDYSKISVDSQTGDNKINVWVARGRDWGETMQKMANEEFTPETGVEVKINILPQGATSVISYTGISQLMLSIVSGNTPDIAMGSDMDSPVELSFRGSAVDLTQFSDFNEVADRFYPATLMPLSFNGKTYALPETMDFPLLIYRNDIFKSNEIKVPNTWDELWKYTIPKLKNLNAYFGISSPLAGNGNNYSTFLFQNGGTYYSDDGKDSLLNNDAAYNAFYSWVRNYTEYMSNPSINLYNEMRRGTLPIAIGYINDYMMLDIAAPELYGRFEIAPIPGTMDKDGNIIRYGSGSVTTAFILKNSDNQNESWEFLKWWTDGNTQERFASEIEAKIGPTARWYSANKESFYSLPWTRERAQIIENWLSEWYMNPKNTLGGYYSTRSINNAFTRTVMNGMKTRDSLEQAYEEIEFEIDRKQDLYGVK